MCRGTQGLKIADQAKSSTKIAACGLQIAAVSRVMAQWRLRTELFHASLHPVLQCKSMKGCSLPIYDDDAYLVNCAFQVTSIAHELCLFFGCDVLRLSRGNLKPRMFRLGRATRCFPICEKVGQKLARQQEGWHNIVCDLFFISNNLATIVGQLVRTPFPQQTASRHITARNKGFETTTCI